MEEKKCPCATATQAITVKVTKAKNGYVIESSFGTMIADSQYCLGDAIVKMTGGEDEL